jgi:nucleoside-diphosphate-sugar epimerase
MDATWAGVTASAARRPRSDSIRRPRPRYIRRVDIVVTGSSGSLGAAAVARLTADGHRVTGFDRAERRTAGAGAQRLDLLETPPEFRWPDGTNAVLHLAGTWAPADATAAGLTAQLRANVELVARALASCGPGVRRFVYVSSMSVYGADCPLPYRETSPIRPDGFYGRTKWLGEEVCRIAGEARPDLEIVVLRLAQVYGPGTPPRVVLYDFIEQALTSGAIRAQCGADLRRDHVHLTDAAEAMALAVVAAPRGTYNVGGGGHTMGELADAIRAAAPRRVSVSFGGAPGVGKALDASAFRAATGFAPRTSLAAGVRLEVTRLATGRP